MKRLSKIFIILSALLSLCLFGCTQPKVGDSINSTSDSAKDQPILPRAGLGEVTYTHIYSPENGNIAVRIEIPTEPRYGETAPVVVVASTWFVEKYNSDETPFHLEFNPVTCPQ